MTHLVELWINAGECIGTLLAIGCFVISVRLFIEDRRIPGAISVLGTLCGIAMTMGCLSVEAWYQDQQCKSPNVCGVVK